MTIRCLCEVEGEVKGKTLACLQLHAMRDRTAGSRLYSLQATALQKLDSSGGLVWGVRVDWRGLGQFFVFSNENKVAQCES